MDIVDLAQEAEMARINRLLDGRLRPVPAFTGECHNCAEPKAGLTYRGNRCANKVVIYHSFSWYF
ncbi:hypothetical protein [Enterobacter kobei]|uniref:hypothetical protein n=1 Tax=Enterobacter kobei TaxID=208224 RepID=UPI003CEC9A1D